MQAGKRQTVLDILIAKIHGGTAFSAYSSYHVV